MVSATYLSHCPAPSGCISIGFGAEPALAETLRYVNLSIVELPQQVIDAFALAFHVTLDPAFGRCRFRCRDRTEQNRLGIHRHRGPAENDRPLVPMPPVPRRDKRTGPQASTGIPCCCLVCIIGMGIANERQCPAGSHHPRAHVLAFDEAIVDRSTVSVATGRCAFPRTPVPWPH